MKHHTFPWQSIKSSVTLFTLVFFIVSLWALSLFAIRTLQSDIERLAGEQQFTTAHIVAGKVNKNWLSASRRSKVLPAGRLQPCWLTGRITCQLSG
ncbi:hypothetical protein [Rhodoferax sp.]|uniref:hypothetical protein n=1 Tax=Rhodoferax sp. TaxID=50421 RepID=UPI002734CA4B|nr:hypothetical protein [Rhodoferax sp.]MDP3191632.1 hypothetical protein [Rhodoferax sp.]MDP3864789.1 hypothetical protein [Rhodoferax sp.]